jgi:hypothetical protein
VKLASALLAILLASAAVQADYQITLRGGTTYWSKRKPAEKNGGYVFTATDGTLLSVRKKDVASIRVAEAPRPENVTPPVGGMSPVEAARKQREIAKSLRERPKTMPQNNDAYRPGIGVPFPAGQNDYVVGKTWAPPPSGKVYSGAAPTGVVSGDAPKGAPSMDAPKGAPDAGATNPQSAPPPPPPPAPSTPPPPPPAR